MKNLLLILSLVFAPYALADFIPGGTGSPASFPSGLSVNSSDLTLTGVTDGSSAGVGEVGEYIEVGTAQTNVTSADGVIADYESIALSAGEWELYFKANAGLNGSTFSRWFIYIDTVAGGTAPNATFEDGTFSQTAPPTSLYQTSNSLLKRVTISSPTTYYFKLRFLYTAGTPVYATFVSARRIR